MVYDDKVSKFSYKIWETHSFSVLFYFFSTMLCSSMCSKLLYTLFLSCSALHFLCFFLKWINLIKCLYVVSVISSDPPCNDWFLRYAGVNYLFFSLFNPFIFICGFFLQSSCAFLACRKQWKNEIQRLYFNFYFCKNRG